MSKNVLCIAECERWRQTENVSAENGDFYPLSSVADCLDLCLSISSCVAVDLGPHGCVLHNKIEDLTTAYYAPGVRQYILNHHCLPTTPLPTTNRATMTVENYTTSSGIHISFFPHFKSF